MESLYHFIPIDLELHRQVVGEFLIDTFNIAQIPIEDERSLIDVYCNSIKRKQERNPEFCSMMFDGDKPIGLVDAFVSTKDPTYGFVSFYYVIPRMRGRGIGKILDERAVRLLKSLGCNRLGLEVADANLNAIAFYKRNGWKFSEDRSKRNLLLMFKNI